jgi:hypothetical protein
MDSIKVTNRIDECLFFELEDHLAQFDAIMDSILQTDVQRHTIREALADWAMSVDDAVGDIIEQQKPEEPTLTADEVFGTEV